MTTSSRYTRPTKPTGKLILQERDRQVLILLARYRYLTADHLHLLVFNSSTLRSAQRRLRQLWLHRFVERCFLPQVLMSQSRTNSRPIYTLGQAGIRAVATAGLPIRPRRPRNATVLEHDLMAADLMCAIEVAARQAHGLATLVEGEHQLRSRQALDGASGAVVPDGAITIEDKDGPRTFYVEIVRSTPRGGNRTLRKKLARYATLNRQGVLKRTFGHRRIRAVLVVAMSQVKARHYQQLAANLPHSRQLFWFATWPERQDGFEPADAIRAIWADGTGASCTIIHQPQG